MKRLALLKEVLKGGLEENLDLVTRFRIDITALVARGNPGTPQKAQACGLR
jgi:hypothetical protein